MNREQGTETSTAHRDEHRRNAGASEKSTSASEAPGAAPLCCLTTYGDTVRRPQLTPLLPREEPAPQTTS